MKNTVSLSMVTGEQLSIEPSYTSGNGLQFKDANQLTRFALDFYSTLLANLSLVV